MRKTVSYDDLTRVVVEATKLARIVIDHGQRLAALETARATAPVSDDEIVEALARTRFENLFVNEVWSTEAEDSQRDFRDFARCQYASLQSLGYDVVKRS